MIRAKEELRSQAAHVSSRENNVSCRCCAHFMQNDLGNFCMESMSQTWQQLRFFDDINVFLIYINYFKGLHIRLSRL